MTEDGRSTGMAALCGRSLNLLRGWGHQDAQLDANTNSLWLLVLAWGCDSARSNFAFLEEISHENVSGK